MIKIIGIGQALRGDDEAGLAAVRLWQQQYPDTANNPDVHVELAESPGLALLDLLQDCDSAILVDAVYSGAPPGTVQTIGESRLASFASGAGSAHGFGVAETIALGRKTQPESIPAQLVLIAVEIQQVATGEGLSTSVMDALPAAAQAIQDQAAKWFN